MSEYLLRYHNEDYEKAIRLHREMNFNTIRLVNKKTGERILPAIMSDGYVTLLPGGSRTVSVEAPVDQMEDGIKVLLKQYGKKEKVGAVIK